MSLASHCNSESIPLEFYDDNRSFEGAEEGKMLYFLQQEIVGNDVKLQHLQETS